METTTVYVVQAWNERYQFWGNTAEPTTGLFDLPKGSYESEDEGRTRLTALQAASPTTQYRLVRATTTQEVI